MSPGESGSEPICRCTSTFFCVRSSCGHMYHCCITNPWCHASAIMQLTRSPTEKRSCGGGLSRYDGGSARTCSSSSFDTHTSWGWGAKRVRKGGKLLAADVNSGWERVGAVGVLRSVWVWVEVGVSASWVECGVGVGAGSRWHALDRPKTWIKTARWSGGREGAPGQSPNP